MVVARLLVVSVGHDNNIRVGGTVHVVLFRPVDDSCSVRLLSVGFKTLVEVESEEGSKNGTDSLHTQNPESNSVTNLYPFSGIDIVVLVAIVLSDDV